MVPFRMFPHAMLFTKQSGRPSATMAYLRAVDVKILQQLVVVNDGIEAVKWLLEELDTLADDMDEYSQNAAETATAPVPGRALVRAEQDWVRMDPERGLAKQEKGRAEHEWPHVDLSPPGLPQDHRFAKEPQVANGYLGQQPPSLEPGRDTKLPSGTGERLGKGNPGGKARKAEADLENCKLNSKLHLEYDAHWRWLQSQDDVTFL
nr:PREDICTED: LOW QUALITY PROTEIN: leucine rich adaptor protein 1 [Opisthocomus hoazin]